MTLRKRILFTTFADMNTIETEWWWGTNISVADEDGLFEVQLDKSMPNVAFVRGLIVKNSSRRKGVGTRMMSLAEDIARKHGKRIMELDADKENEWLWKWYERLGYVILSEDDHNYCMIKML